MPIHLTQRLQSNSTAVQPLTLSLTADERTRSRHYFVTDEGQEVYLRLPRGNVLQHGDLLQSETGEAVVQIVAKPEPVLTVTAKQPIDLLRAAYHLGNRHVALEVTETYLRLPPDPVLQVMLEQMGLTVIREITPFQPEAGAYGHHSQPTEAHHSHSH